MARVHFLSNSIARRFNPLQSLLHILPIAAVIVLFSACISPARAQDCSASPANPGNYAISLSIPGFPGGGQYIPVCFSWGPSAGSTGQGVSRELRVTTSMDSTVADLMTAAQSQQLFPTAELQQSFAGASQSNVVVDIQMSNVRIASVQVSGDSQAPQRVVTLTFQSVTFTFQPVNPIGQKAGPPVSFSATFKK